MAGARLLNYKIRIPAAHEIHFIIGKNKLSLNKMKHIRADLLIDMRNGRNANVIINYRNMSFRR